MTLRITGGAVHDPANGVDGAIRDVCIKNGRVVESLPADAPKLDASGMVVMPGGVDLHSHFASASCNHARRLIPDEHAADPVAPPELLDGEPLPRSGSGGTVPSTFTTGYRYAGLGYTTAFDAAVAPLLARHSHAELDDTPCVDGGIFVLMGNDEYLLRQIQAGERDRARDYAAWLLGATGGYAIKTVNPGGVEAWKIGQRNVSGIDDSVGGRATPRAILEVLADAANALKLPHPVHIHCNNLGVPGNGATTLATMEALSGRRAHLTHLQFHSYGGEPGKGWSSGATKVMEYVNAHREVSIDVGQVMFGPATTITADAPVEYLLSKSSGRRWTNIDIELETGCGIVPLTYKDKAAVSALQWAIGLEIFLLSADPWRVVLSTDHPNGGSFLSYPDLIQLLMDRSVRDQRLMQVNPKLLAGSALADGLAREYTLNEIAIITRAGPARLLGLGRKGHLGIGADADVTIYSRDPDIAKMFSTPRYVLKGGVVVVEDGQLRRAPAGNRLRVAPEYDDAFLADLRRHFSAYSTVSFDNYPVRDLPGDAGMNVRGVFIEDTFAEAFTMRVARILITARNPKWAREAALKLTGFATSVIGCKVEAGIERLLQPEETPDGRPGIAVLLMTMSKDDMPKRLIERIGQTVLTCPTTACYDGMADAPDRVGVGSALRFFGDGFQGSKMIAGQRYWRIPVMEGEFLIQEKFGMIKGVGGGNFLILARSPDAALEAAEAGAEAMSGLGGVILPFPGGVVRSGSKVGSRRIKSMIASTNDAYCPTLRAVTETNLPEGVNSVLEIVINGVDAPAIAGAMRAGIDAACREGVVAITAGNYGGKLGPHHFHLRKIMSGEPG